LLDFPDLHFLYGTVVVIDDSLEIDEGADHGRSSVVAWSVW
jgi:hypothetical protein